MTTNQAAGLCTTVILHGVLLTALVIPKSWVNFGGGCSSASKPKALDDDVMVIEAAIAYKKEDAPKQPQKQRSPEKIKVKPEGISRDENKPVTDKKPEDKPKNAVETPDWRDFKRTPDDDRDPDPDLEEGPQLPRPGGAWDGEKFGWADVNKGHPYLRELAKDVIAEVPTLVKEGSGVAQACVRLEKDGTVVDTKVREKSGNATLDRAADEAVRKLQEKRKDPKDVKPVPPELIEITTKWLCFPIGT